MIIAWNDINGVQLVKRKLKKTQKKNKRVSVFENIIRA
jgi:hypothetical protein